MKKSTHSILFFLLIFLINFCVGCTPQNEGKEILQYLENRYNKKFEILNPLDDQKTKDEGYVIAFIVYPTERKDILFVAGKKRERTIHPYVLPLNEVIYFDDFFETSKQHIMNELISEEPLILNSVESVEYLTESIYVIMEEMNNQLSALGFTTTKYSCSVELSIIANQRTQKINFYILDRSIIYELLYNAYNNS